jgi:hypothetical protein
MQRVEDAFEAAIPKCVPGIGVQVDLDHLMAETPQRLRDLRARPQRDLTLG